MKRLPEEFEEWEVYDDYEFTWAGDGMRPTIKKRWSTRLLYNPVGFETLIAELKTGKVRTRTPPVAGLSQEAFRHRFGDRQKGLSQ